MIGTPALREPATILINNLIRGDISIGHPKGLQRGVVSPLILLCIPILKVELLREFCLVEFMTVELLAGARYGCSGP